MDWRIESVWSETIFLKEPLFEQKHQTIQSSSFSILLIFFILCDTDKQFWGSGLLDGHNKLIEDRNLDYNSIF